MINSVNKISHLFERWGPENDFNALEVLFRRGDLGMLRKFAKACKERGKLKFSGMPECSLKEINTGYNDKFAYGVRTRKVALARGGREGNNAFVYDLANEGEWSHYLF